MPTPRYDHDKYRRLVWQRGIKPVIARRQTEYGSVLTAPAGSSNAPSPGCTTSSACSCYERRAEMHQAVLGLACCLVCFRRLRSSI